MNNMTIPTDLSARVAALATLSCIPRRIECLAVLATMLRTPLPVRASTAKLWQELGYQLDLCGIELRVTLDPLDRDATFVGHARLAYQLAEALLEQIAALGAGKTQRMPQSWQPHGRVVDVAPVAQPRSSLAQVEVAS